MAEILKLNWKRRAQIRHAGHESIAKSFDTEKETKARARKVEAGLINPSRLSSPMT